MNLDRVQLRLRELHARIEQDRAAAAANVEAARARRDAQLPTGARVLDPVTGLEGVIIGGHTENVVVQPTRRADRANEPSTAG